jgi:hypothetical protein
VRADARALQHHPSQPSLPDHPLLVGLVGPTGSPLVRVRLGTTLVAICLGTILGTCRSLCPVRRGRAILSGIRLRDYDAISITPIRNDRYKTTILVGTTSAFDAVGELDAQLLRTLAGRILGDMSQYEDK